MRIYSISIRNYRPFKVLGETRLGPLATIVGKNDTPTVHDSPLRFGAIALA